MVFEGGNATYEVAHKTGPGVYHLVDNTGDVLATATKPSAWKLSDEMEYNGSKPLLDEGTPRGK